MLQQTRKQEWLYWRELLFLVKSSVAADHIVGRISEENSERFTHSHPCLQGEPQLLSGIEPGTPHAHTATGGHNSGSQDSKPLDGGNQSLGLELAFLSQCTKIVWLCSALFSSL